MVISSPRESQSFVSFLPPRPLRKLTQVRATSTNAGQSSPPSAKRKNPLAVIWDVPRNIWRQTLHPLSDFGFGRKSIWEGGVGLFFVTGAVLFALSMVWLKGFYLRSRHRKYQTVFEFAQACGISMGTPVRIRGVTVGSVVRIVPTLKSIDAVVEVSICYSFFIFIENFNVINSQFCKCQLWNDSTLIIIANNFNLLLPCNKKSF